MKQKRQAGFTILELMIASSLFSVVLLVIAAGILRFSHDYYKGINSTNTQAVTRGVMSDIVQNIQFGRNVSNRLVSGTINGYCIDNTFYTFRIGQMVTSSQSGLVKTDGTSCQSVTPTLPQPSALNRATQRDLLSQQMRVTKLDINKTASGAYTVELKVAFGESNLFINKAGATMSDSSPASDWADAVCGSATGSQFCIVSQLSTTVDRRL